MFKQRLIAYQMLAFSCQVLYIYVDFCRKNVHVAILVIQFDALIS